MIYPAQPKPTPEKACPGRDPEQIPLFRSTLRLLNQAKELSDRSNAIGRGSDQRF